MDEYALDARDERLAELEQELKTTQEYMQTVTEEYKASNEELKSTSMSCVAPMKPIHLRVKNSVSQ